MILREQHIGPVAVVTTGVIRIAAVVHARVVVGAVLPPTPSGVQVIDVAPAGVASRQMAMIIFFTGSSCSKRWRFALRRGRRRPKHQSGEHFKMNSLFSTRVAMQDSVISKPPKAVEWSLA